jgi:hypothetical protein
MFANTDRPSMNLPELYVKSHVDGDRLQSAALTVSNTMLLALRFCVLIQLAAAMAAFVYTEFPVFSARYADRLYTRKAISVIGSSLTKRRVPTS